jgi:hypothetical protein
MFKPEYIKQHTKAESKAIPVTGREGRYGCETSRLPQFLGSWFRDGCKVGKNVEENGFSISKGTISESAQKK